MQEYGFLPYIPLRPTFLGNLLDVLRIIPPVESDGKGRFRLPTATIVAWNNLEIDLSFALNCLNCNNNGYVIFHFPYPSTFGFTRAHSTKHVAERQARMSRDWFMILMGAISYVALAPRPIQDTWFDRLKENNASQLWIASIEASTIMDKDYERVGCFLHLVDETREIPEPRVLRRLKVPM
jgi:hypothetical protein